MTLVRSKAVSARNQQWRDMRADGVTLREIAEHAGVSQVTVWFAVNDIRQDSKTRNGAGIANTDELRFREMAKRGSQALLLAMWKYGAAHNGLPNMTRAMCMAKLIEAGS